MAARSRTVAVPTARSGADDAEALRVAFARLHRQLRTRMGRDLTPSQSSALARIEQAGPLRLGALAELEGTSGATMSKVVASLEDLGLVERSADAADGRASLLELSVEGDQLLTVLRERGSAALRAALHQLDEDDRRSLQRAIPVLEQVSLLLQEGDAVT
jgi:DNA-binding MarR family transcriptional regulator